MRSSTRPISSGDSYTCSTRRGVCGWRFLICWDNNLVENVRACRRPRYGADRAASDRRDRVPQPPRHAARPPGLLGEPAHRPAAIERSSRPTEPGCALTLSARARHGMFVIFSNFEWSRRRSRSARHGARNSRSIAAGSVCRSPSRPRGRAACRGAAGRGPAGLMRRDQHVAPARAQARRFRRGVGPSRSGSPSAHPRRVEHGVAVTRC